MVRNTSMRNTLANAYAAAGPNGALFSADPGTTDAATNELTGGTPAYARKNMGWATAANGSVTSAATTFDVSAGSTVAYFGVCTSATRGTADVRDSAAVTSQTFNSQGTYAVTAIYNQT